MERPCAVTACTGHATRWGRHCSNHAAHARRHGHPRQRAVTKTELKPYEALINARIERNRDNPVWPGLEANWKALEAQAEQTLATYQRGAPSVRYVVSAAREVVRLGHDVEPRQIIVTALAMYLLQDANERRFLSDEAFAFQLARRVRRLTATNAGTSYDHVSGRVKRVYRELPPRVARTFSGWVIAVLVGTGILIARLERRQREEKQQRMAAMAAALETLK